MELHYLDIPLFFCDFMNYTSVYQSSKQKMEMIMMPTPGRPTHSSACICCLLTLSQCSKQQILPQDQSTDRYVLIRPVFCFGFCFLAFSLLPFPHENCLEETMKLNYLKCKSTQNLPSFTYSRIHFPRGQVAFQFCLKYGDLCSCSSLIITCMA